MSSRKSSRPSTVASSKATAGLRAVWAERLAEKRPVQEQGPTTEVSGTGGQARKRKHSEELAQNKRKAVTPEPSKY